MQQFARPSLACAALLSALLATAGGCPRIPRCSAISADCSRTTCYVACAGGEAELRAAVEDANSCASTPGFTRRTIRFNSPCTVDLTNAEASADGVAVCTTEESQSAFAYSICLTGHHITVDGRGNVTFNYGGSAVCEATCDSCGPAPFVLRGNFNTVKRATIQFFPEGIAIRSGTGHTVEGIVSQYYCDEAVSIGGSPEPTNATVRACRLTGHTTDPRCVLLAGTPTCGFDKAIQVNSGTDSIISGNIFTNAGQPVKVVNGTHTIADNTAIGTPPGQGSNPDDQCQNFSVAGGTTTMSGNTIRHCKFGIRVAGTGIVDANSNTITDCYLSAFSVRDTGQLKGAGNRIRNCGFFTGSSCHRGGVAAWNSAAARVDFGGGDCNGQAITGSPSTGGNLFCQGGLTDIWNRTYSDSPSCTGAVSAACIGARANCFDDVPSVVGGAVDTTGSTSGCDCSF